jgi:hypothetical protein
LLAGNGNSSRVITSSFANAFSTALLAYSAIGPLINEFEQPRSATISVA